ncbi:MAG: ATP-binding protein, partial [Bacteroidota bacterium]
RFEKYLIPNCETFDRVFNIIEWQKNELLLILRSGKMYLFKDEVFNLIPFPSQKITKLYKDRDQNTWISTSDQGLFKVSKSTGSSIPFQWQNLNKSHPNLPSSIYQIEEDHHRNFWLINGENQILTFPKDQLDNTNKDLAIDYFGFEHGLPLIDLNIRLQPTSKVLSDGKIIFPNIFGAIQIDPDQHKSALKPFQVLISNFMDSSIQKTAYHHTLNYGENDIRFSVRGISLYSDLPIQYKYRFENKDWVELASGKDILINNIPPGKNTIEINAKYANEEWNAKSAFVYIDVPPLYYQTWWFWVIAFILASALVTALILWRTGIVKRQRNQLALKVKEQTKEIEQEKEHLSISLQKQKELTLQLKDSQETKNRMYAQISHEFNSPLQSVRGLLVNNNKIFSESDQNRAISNVEKLINISGEMMHLSKAESGKLVANKDWYNINNVIQQQIHLIEDQALRKGIEIVFNKDKEDVYLNFDLNLIQKVITNLISNAIKFSSKGQKIIIQSKRKGKEHNVIIEDQGQGIPKKEIPLLTQAFYQASNNSIGGTGIGLSLVKEILQLHDSALQIESELTKGSSFKFTLASASAEEILKLKDKLSVNIQEEANRIVNKNLPIILTIDDSEDVLYFLERTLKPNYNIIKALNGAQALKLLESFQPNIIISDVNMPIMNGIAFLKVIRDMDSFRATPVIFLTGSTSEETEILGIKSGVDAILKKPVDEARLKEQVKQLLRQRDSIMSSFQNAFVHNLLPKDVHNDDLLFMQKIEQIMLEHITESQLTSADFASFMGIGEKTLRNRIKRIAGITLKEYLRNYRLEKSKMLIEEGYGTLSEIAAATGHSSLSYFSKRFKLYFGESPG